MRGKTWWLIALACLCPTAASASSGFEFGGGMEYFTVAAYERDLEGYYFQPVLQTTLARARLAYTLAPFRAEVTRGWSDWPLSGEWRGSNIIPSSLTDYVTVESQEHWQVEAGYRFMAGWDLLAGYEDHQLRHYLPDLRITYLQYHLQAWQVGLQYTPLVTSSVQLKLAGFFAPRTALSWYENPYLNPTDYSGIVTGPVEDSSTGWRAQGRLQFQYRDSGGWGIDIGYLAGFARFTSLRNLSEISLRYGTLTGYFSLLF